MVNICAGQAALLYKLSALYRPLMKQAPVSIYCKSGTRNHRFQPSAAAAALHRLRKTGLRKVRRAAARQNTKHSTPAIIVVSRWVCSSPVKPMASAAQHHGWPLPPSSGWA